MLILYIISTSTIKSQTLYPEIINYSFGSNQNWSIDVNLEQSLVVANNSGLSTFNGQSWSMHYLPKNMIVRSVLCDNDRIYTGAYEEFGYWKKDKFGELKYNSLKNKFGSDSPQQSEEFWQIIKFKDDIIFRSFGTIYSYDGDTIKRISSTSNISSLCVYNNKLLFGSLDDGLLEIVNSEAKPYAQNKEIKELKAISKVFSLKDFLFVFDINLGGYIMKGNEVSKLPEAINEMLQDYALNKVAFIDNSKIAFGTVKNGVVIYNFIRDTYEIINKLSGLKNNTVLDMKVDKNNLWLALDNGISKIDIKSEYSYFNDDTGVLGTVYDVAYFDNKYYLASNTGVYTFYNNQLTLIKNSEGHCWGFFNYQNMLLCAHNKGAFILEGKNLKRIEGSFSGVYNFLAIPNSREVLVSTYSGIGVLEPNNDEFIISKLEGLDVPVDKLIFENDSIIWATVNYKGLYKIDFDTASHNVKYIQRKTNNSIIDDNKVELESVNDQSYFIINNNWFTYSNEDNTFSEFVGFENKSLLGQRKSGFWLLDNATSNLTNYDRNFGIKDLRINKNLVSKFVSGYEKIRFKNDSTAIFNLRDGFSTLNLKSNFVSTLEKPKIAKIFVNREIYELPEIKKITLNNKEARLVAFDVYIPGGFEKQLQYELTGELNHYENILNGNFTLQNLPFGDYELAIFEKGYEDAKTLLQIEILPPWYLSKPIKISYALLLLTILYLVGKYQKNKAEKAHRKSQNRLLEEARQKLELIEKNNLIKEVKTKKKELTNRTASIVQKNETIILLRNELKRLEKTSPNITRTKNILNRSGKQLDSKNDWTIFESKFNELNEDFFKSLSKAFPKLTTKDRKLCAYIKIGLTSKEIAPLLGISVRSVELQRYRLRKKLKLDTKISFNEFLEGF